MTKAHFFAAIFALAALAPLPVLAQDPSPESAEVTREQKKQIDLDKARQEAILAAIAGPKDVPVGANGILHLPANYVFIPQPQAGKLKHAMGSFDSPQLKGLISRANAGGYLAILDYLDDGHVKDDDAKTWNADDLLKSLQDGTESANADRVARGFPELEVTGWLEKPVYDAAQHRLVWSALVKPKLEEGGSANYNTYALGRDGHYELNLIADAGEIDTYKADAQELLAALEFRPGSRYQDYNPKTDRLAEYGLAALIGGVAAKKLGLLAIAAGFLAKFAKLIVVGLVALGGGLKSLFRRKSQ